jgi:hypothetical protein
MRSQGDQAGKISPPNLNSHAVLGGGPRWAFVLKAEFDCPGIGFDRRHLEINRI